MIVKNLNDPDVIRTTEVISKGATIRWLLTENVLRGLQYIAYAVLPPGKEIEEHIDPVEEVFFVLKGRGLIEVERERRELKERDIALVPAGTAHSLRNHTDGKLELLIIAAYPRRK